MYCLSKFCYVCLEEKDKLLNNINSSLSVHKDIIHIIDHLPFNLTWLKTLRVILICEDCCFRLRETHRFREKCLKNSALLQRYMVSLNTAPTSNTENVAELLVKLNITQDDVNAAVAHEVQTENEEIRTFQWQPNIEKIGDVFVVFEDSLIKEGIICKREIIEEEETEVVYENVQDYFVKEENTWKQEEVDDPEEYPMDNSCTENMDRESDPEMSVSDDAHHTNTTHRQTRATNKNDLNTAAKTSTKSVLNMHTGKKSYECAICKRGFSRKEYLVRHMRIHTGEKPYSCTRCKKCFTEKSNLVRHMRVHTGEKPYSCTRCKKCFTEKSKLVRHVQVHTGEKPYSCTRCKKCFSQKSNLVCHMRVHTGEKPYSCTRCKKCFNVKSSLVRHVRVHTGEKPYSCTRCKKFFNVKSVLVCHMRLHTGEKPYSCTRCKKCFSAQSNLVSHMRVHTGEKPYECTRCKKCFSARSYLVRHMRTHTPEKQ